MKKELVFATNNQHKLKEIEEILGSQYHIMSLKELGCNEDIPETSDTLEGNARQKARYIYNKFNKNCFADDTGLEITALNGRPGVYSARYGGSGRDPKENMKKVLREMDGITKREARFRTIICLIIDDKEMLFEGVVNGCIRTTESGDEGFGYDPIFEPQGYSITFAQMDMEEKNKISHRGKAMAYLIDYLKTL